jgi:copper chaperone CopZ
VCAHAVRVALKSIKGVETVEVSLDRGEAVATFASGNTVRYEDLLRAIEKNGFVVKGSKLVADGHLDTAGDLAVFDVTGSNDHFRLEPANKTASPLPQTQSRLVEVTGAVPEVAKGKAPDVLRYDLLVLK